MKDNAEFNIRFVGLIEKHTCIYDHSSLGYANRNLQEKTWEKLSKEVEESVPDCKERWKNLRGSYTRYLKHRSNPLAKKKKPYYLAKRLSFLRPFTKSRDMKSGIETSSAVTTIDNSNGSVDSESNNEDEVDGIKLQLDSHSENSFPSPTSSRESPWNTHFTDTHHSSSGVVNTENCHGNSDKSTALFEDRSSLEMKYFQRKGKILNIEQKYEDPDVSFLMSILPDMREMSDSQKRRFKIEILSSAESILDKNTD